MKEYIFTELGYFNERECQAIKSAMEGKTFMHFHIKWGSAVGNCTLIVMTDYDATEEEVKNFFLHCALAVIFDLERALSKGGAA